MFRRNWYQTLPLRYKIPLIPTLVFLVMGVLGQFLTDRLAFHRYNLVVEDQLRSSHELVHDFIATVNRESLRNYLRGIADEALREIEALAAEYDQSPDEDPGLFEDIANLVDGIHYGPNGYSAIINRQGVVRHHPDGALIGEDLSHLTSVRDMIRQRNGYLEYNWDGSAETRQGAKAAYLREYLPWDWIFVITVYRQDFRDLVDRHALTQALRDSLTAGGDAYIVDRRGTLVIHPQLTGWNLTDFEPESPLIPMLDIGTGSGTFNFLAPDPETGEMQRRRLHYSWQEEFDWLIVTEVTLDSIYEPLNITLRVNWIVTLVTVVVLGAVLYVLGSLVVAPLRRLYAEVVSRGSGDLDLFTAQDRGDEISRLALAFGRFRDRIEADRAEMERIARFTNESPMPIVRIRDDWSCEYMNGAARASVASSLLNERGAVSQRWREALSRCMDSFGAMSIRIGGSEYLASSSGRRGDGEAYIALLDVTERQKYQTLLSVWQGMFDHSLEGIMLVDQASLLERVNESFCRITGHKNRDSIGLPFADLLFPPEEADQGALDLAKLDHGTWTGELRMKKKSGEELPVWLAVSPFHDAERHQRKHLVIFHDISDLKKQQALLDEMANFDALTGLANRVAFRAALEETLDHPDPDYRCCSAVILLDLDGFTMVNDSYGLPAGDRLLRDLADAMKSRVRGDDVLARIGGDEFAVLLPGLEHKEDYEDVLKRLREVFDRPFPYQGSVLRVSASAGVAFAPDDGSTVDEVMSAANVALKRSKTLRRGSYSVYDSDLDRATAARYARELAMGEALEADEFSLVFQPLVRPEDGSVESFEALLRWRQGDGSIVSPAEFIPLAEDSGLVIPLGMRVVEMACDFLSRFPDDDDSPRVGINISARQFHEHDFLHRLTETVSKAGIRPQRIHLEITENIAATTVGDAFSLLQKLSDLGYSIAIDDFGTGYSSLMYIRHFAFDSLKIDKSFVDDLPGDESAMAIVRAIITMGKTLGKSIVAEGVETDIQLEALRSEGCDLIQGYRFSRPLPADEAFAYWKNTL